MIVAILRPALLVITAVAVDIGLWYVEGVKVQKAADAAALGGVTSIYEGYPEPATRPSSSRG